MPERIADHRAGGAAAGPVVIGGKGAAQHRHDPEHVEEISADILTLRVTGDTAEGKIEAPCTPGDRACEGLLQSSDLFPLCISKPCTAGGEIARAHRALREIDVNQLLGSLDRQGAQSYRVDELEYGAVGPDTERQREHCHRRESGILPKLPDAISQVKCEGMETLRQTHGFR